MSKKVFAVLAFVMLLCLGNVAVATAEDYVFTFSRIFYSSDRGITVKFYVDAVDGSRLIPEGSAEYASTHMPTYISMSVNGKHHAHGPVSVIEESQSLGGPDKNLKRSRPYILYDDFSEDEYAIVAGKKMEVTFYAYETAYARTITFGSMPAKLKADHRH